MSTDPVQQHITRMQNLSTPEIQQAIHDALPCVAGDRFTIEPEEGSYYALKYGPLGREQQVIAQHLLYSELWSLKGVVDSILQQAEKVLRKMEAE